MDKDKYTGEMLKHHWNTSKLLMACRILYDLAGPTCRALFLTFLTDTSVPYLCSVISLHILSFLTAFAHAYPSAWSCHPYLTPQHILPTSHHNHLLLNQYFLQAELVSNCLFVLYLLKDPVMD